MGTGGSARRRQGGGSVDSAEAIRVLGQLGQRSTLFRWLFDHYDEIQREIGAVRPGVPWAQYCGYLEELGLTLAGGERITPRGAAQTWYRLRKEKGRLAALDAAEEAAREARRQERERLRRFDMPPLAVDQPPRAPPTTPLPVRSRPGAPATPAAAGVGEPTEATRIGWGSPSVSRMTPSDRQMPGGPPPIGGWEEKLVWEDFTVALEGEPFDLRLMIDLSSQRDVKRPWRVGDVSPQEQARAFQAYLADRYEDWLQGRKGYSANQIDRTWRKYLGTY
jgi:hypothetical protein